MNKDERAQTRESVRAAGSNASIAERSEKGRGSMFAKENCSGGSLANFIVKD